MMFDRAQWVGRKFKDNDTGEVLTIPLNVMPKQFFSFGSSFIDVGDGYYARSGGDFVEITDPESGEFRPEL